MWYEEQSSFFCRFIQWVSLALLLTLPVNLAHAEAFERQVLEIPQLASNQPLIQTTDTQPQLTRTEFTLGKNQTLTHALETINPDKAAQLAYLISQSSSAELFTQLQVGETLVLWSDEQQNLQRIDLQKTPSLSYHLEREQNSFKIYSHTKPIEVKIKMVSATIDDSFYLAGDQAGLSARTIMNLADIFAWEVDFVRELRSGDQFKVIYEQRFLDNKYLGDGAILAAELTVGGQRQVKAFQLKDQGKHIGYYNEKGENLKKAFLRNPINYTRISSRYQRNRYHPVKKELRDHKGVDYAAPTGTPIYAAGDGVISFRGWRGGYGRQVIIKHAGRYQTVYAHLSRYGKQRAGQHVKQGDIIGYVGMTGLATGPHLHYEFRINGRHVDPLKVKFPDSAPVHAKYRDEFQHYASVMDSQLMRIDPELTQLALNFE
jgi:murein DD-endopeptidase MepM/ murein hydrolase activator NlpD